VNRPLSLALVLALVALGAAGCGKKKPVPTVAPPPVDTAPKITPKVEPPPPPLTVDQKLRIAGDFDRARKIVIEARDLRLKGEAIEREKGREAANDTYVLARKKYREAAAATERWVEPELREVTQKQLDKDAELKAYFTERGSWIQEDASMGQKLNAR
jgi:hypothetical protein